MWKYILDMGRRVLLLVEDTRRHGEAIKELQREVRELASAVERLAYGIHRASERSDHQHEVTQLRLENELLRFRQQLPVSEGDTKRKDEE
ncbi:MAG: hypothetical protein M3371_13075 [Acidobacteriota bacterium]|nr:hypothetical protein [Acidobacteriota bacterium]